ncbi:MAG TPA: hypothetical protein PJ991_07400 [Kiritimatiellia bacterium]|nr:hypothetical protein [Kiritimatiellia bacterium]
MATRSWAAQEITSDMLPLVISQPGLYRATEPLNATAADHAIIVEANGVTIDLNGFTLTWRGGGDANGFGVFQSPAFSGLTVMNGGFVNWQGDFIFAVNAGGGNNRLIDLRVEGGASGLKLGDGGAVDQCIVYNLNGTEAIGIEVGAGGRISACRVASVFGTVAVGMKAGDGASISRSGIRSVFGATAARAIWAARDVAVEHVTVSDVIGGTISDGIFTTAGGMIRYCAVGNVAHSFSNGMTQGIALLAGSQVFRSTVSSMSGPGTVVAGAGIYASEGRVTECVVFNNVTDGIQLENRSIIQRNLSARNSKANFADGMTLSGQHSRIDNNHFVNNLVAVNFVFATNNLLMRNSDYFSTLPFGAISNHIPQALVAPGLDFNALANPYNFQTIRW